MNSQPERNMEANQEDTEGRRVSWREFTQGTTMHGLKSLWLILIVACLIYFAIATKTFMADYIQKTISTKVKISQKKELPFPVITICNRNILRMSYMTARSLDLETFAFHEVYRTLQDRTLLAEAHFNWSDPYYSPVAALSPNETENLYKEAAHELSTSVWFCLIKGIVKDCADVIKVVKTSAGYCFQLNSEQTIYTQAPGVVDSISLMLNTEVWDYFIGEGTYSEGFYHKHKHEVPLVKELSVGVGPGLQSSIMLLKSQINRVPPPADGNKADCLDVANELNPLVYYSNYSYSGCFSECHTSYILERCGCRDPLQPALNNSPSCTIPEMIECSQSAHLDFASHAEGLRKCKCPHPCKESEYTAQVSTYRFPNPTFMKMFGYSAGSIPHLRENALWVDIYFGKMSVTVIDEYIAYDGFDMIANLGGTFGLCIGASLLTICEFAEFLILALIGLLRQRQPPATVVYPTKPKTRLSIIAAREVSSLK